MYENLKPQEIYQKILDCEINRFPNRYWQQSGVEQECKIITKYLIEKVLELKENEVPSKMSAKLFRKYKLSGMLEYVFDGSYFKAIDNAYPNKYRMWEFNCVPWGFWNDTQHVYEAIDYLLTQTGKNKYTELTNVDFVNHKLGGLMDYIHRYNLDLDFTDLEDKHNLKDIIQTVSFSTTNKEAKRNRILARLELPVSMLEAIGVTSNNSKVILRIENGRIIVQPK